VGGHVKVKAGGKTVFDSGDTFSAKAPQFEFSQ